MPTPNIDAAIRAGCSYWRDKTCTYPACICAPIPERSITDALRAVIPKEPPAEVIEAAADALNIKVRSGPVWRWLNDVVLATYKSQPIYLELWGDE